MKFSLMFRYLGLVPTLMVLAIASGCASTDQNINSGLWHFNAGLWGEASYRLQSSVPDLEKSTPQDPRLPTALVALGDMANNAQRTDQAENFYARAIKAADGQTPPNNVSVRNALVHAGFFYQQLKRPSEALPLFNRAADISETDLTIPRTLHAVDLDNIAVAYGELERYPEGESFSLRALKVLDSAQSEPDSTKTRGIVFYNLAYAYEHQQRPAEADSYYRKALDLMAIYGEPWRQKAVLDNYSKFLRSIGREQDAERLRPRALESKPKCGVSVSCLLQQGQQGR